MRDQLICFKVYSNTNLFTYEYKWYDMQSDLMKAQMNALMTQWMSETWMNKWMNE